MSVLYLYDCSYNCIWEADCMRFTGKILQHLLVNFFHCIILEAILLKL